MWSGERTKQARTRITQTAEAAAAAATTTKRKRWRVSLGSLRCVFIFMNDVSAHRFVPYNSATKRQKQLSFMWLLYLRFFVVIVAVVAKKAKRQPKATTRRVALIDQLLCNCISAGLRVCVCVLLCMCVGELLAHTKPKSSVASFFLGKRARIGRVRERGKERERASKRAPQRQQCFGTLSLSLCLFYYNINSFFGQWPKQRSLLR